GHLIDARTGGQRLARFETKDIHHIQYTRWQEIADQLQKNKDGERGLLSRLEDNAVARGQRWSELPGRHQNRTVPWDDHSDYAERLVIVIGNRLGIDLRDAALLSPDAPAEVAEVID